MGATVKYLLMIHLNPTTFESLSEDDKQAVFGAHDDFIKLTKESGEFVSSIALADPSNSTTVRVRDEAAAVTDGPFVESKEFLAGYYIVDTETVERAQELAAMIPDARFSAIEVRPVMNEAGLEM
jgi:hypothetical protein